MTLCVKHILFFIQIGISITLALSKNNNSKENFLLRKIVETAFQPVLQILDVSSLRQDDMTPASILDFIDTESNPMSFVQLRSLNSHNTLETNFKEDDIQLYLKTELKQSLQPIYYSFGLTNEGVPDEKQLQSRPAFII
ncbi:uncharacterized protein LOC128883879 [Hylaeus volcanicus]|uniref:uncharacterized protein LOC128883879 n=1 Tax=Hylaeus volcanicus TaxID=313075 RepID=UPI0023B7B67A|nr:uncharacterized protein LOC128883879 [Hylaeus volcanicus]